MRCMWDLSDAGLCVKRLGICFMKVDCSLMAYSHGALLTVGVDHHELDWTTWLILKMLYDKTMGGKLCATDLGELKFSSNGFYKLNVNDASKGNPDQTDGGGILRDDTSAWVVPRFVVAVEVEPFANKQGK
ncbi:hypothetical protein RIF29_10653 [Crotalaria pallida]|uniref:Uncharacterized protein n=1 Tax=Crotalaria pallida TaxID=3830 RepID=A0AAN9FSX1_CROPI